MSAAKQAADRCPTCNGPLATLGKNRLDQPIQKCCSCGREFGRAASDAPPLRRSSPAASTITIAVAKPCSVAGCPGTVDGSGTCPCCVRRAAWAEAHMPKRQCAICEGLITGRTNLRAAAQLSEAATVAQQAF
jgi:hypothetical protein